MKILLIVLMALMAGCASNPDYESWARAVEAQHDYAKQAASGCQTDLCRYVVTEKVAANTIRAPRQQIHPGWELAFKTFNTVATLGLPAYFGVENSKVWADMTTGIVGSIGSMDRSYTDNSVSIGRDQISGTQDNSQDSSIGGNQNIGDRYADSSDRSDNSNHSVTDNSRNDSSDNSQTDNSDNSDNSETDNSWVDNTDNSWEDDNRAWSDAPIATP